MWSVTSCVCVLLSAFLTAGFPRRVSRWEPDDDGFRGYVFATEDNRTVVLTIKGTSIPIVGGGPTIEKDKLNDNLHLSCCCARVSRTWTPVCDCYRGGGNVTNNASKML